MSRVRLLSAAIAGLLLTACAASPPAALPQLPAPLALQVVGRIDPAGAFAVDPPAERLAWARAGLRLRHLDRGDEQLLDSKTPLALAWNRDGTRLAAAFAEGSGCRVQVYSGQDSLAAADRIDLPGRPASLAWRDATTLTLVTVDLADYRFGSNARTTLSSWSPPQPVVEIDRYDTTLKPLTRAALGADPQRICRHRLSPAGDEVLHTSLHDPPAVDSYRVLVLRHLDSGAGRDLARLPIATGEFQFGPEDTVLFGDGRQTRLIDPWSGVELHRWPSAGNTLALSADGHYLFADGHLYDGETELATLPADAAAFTAAGLLLRHDRQLLIVHGLAPAPRPPLPRPELEKLRAWRSRGLIDQDEYLRFKESQP